jgi:hypothetical protein
MAVRVSFSTDAEAMELIDRFAKEHGIDRNRAILELIENGYARFQGAEMTTMNQKRAFEEYERLNAAIHELRASVEGLGEEIRLIRHLLDREYGSRDGVFPYQSSRWWEFWRRV